MAPVVSKQAASPSIPEAHDAVQAASVNHGGACLPQQLHDARLQKGTQKWGESGASAPNSQGGREG